MALDLGDDVRTWMLSIAAVSSAVGTRCHDNHVPKNVAKPYIWFRQGAIQNDDCLDDAAGQEPLYVAFDVEICSDELQESFDVAKAIRDAVPFRGTLGAHTVKLVSCSQHDEDYLFQGPHADEVAHLQALQIQVYP